MAERVFAAINDDDLEAFLAEVAKDVEFVSLVAEADGRVYRGHDGVREWWRDVRPILGGLQVELQSYEEHEDTAVTKIRVHGRVGGTDLAQTMDQGAMVRDGKLVWWQAFRSEEEARAGVRARLRA